jgi:AcrR family transcriptional regulator
MKARSSSRTGNGKASRSFSKESAEIRRQQLIDATFRSLCRFGPAETSVRSIAAEAGLSLGMVRHHFRSKDQLLAECYRALSAQLQAETSKALDRAGADPAARLHALIVAGLRPPILDRDYIRLRFMFWDLSHTNAAVRRVHDEIYARFENRLRELVAAAAKASRARIDADAATLTIMALLKGLWLEWSLSPDRTAPSTLIERVLPLLTWSRHASQAKRG